MKGKGVFRMQLNEKIQELRKKKGLTQEELAKELYVSRTAISKWESGRGMPNIESLRAIAEFFSVTVDELLSSDEILSLAEKDGKRKEKHFRDLVYGLLDVSMAMLLFLPFFAERSGTSIQSASLLRLGEISLYLKIFYFVLVLGISILGIVTLALQNCQAVVWEKSKVKFSLVLHTAAVLAFIFSLQPYAAGFSFVLLAIKVLLRLKRS